MSQNYAKKVDKEGGPFGSSRRLYGLSKNTLKTHYALSPLLFLTAVSVVGGIGYLLRIGIQHPEISWFHKHNMMPWRNVDSTYKYRMYSPLRVYEKENWPEEMPKIK